MLRAFTWHCAFDRQRAQYRADVAYMKHLALLALVAVILVSGCVDQAEKCRLSLCDCGCHTGPITEDTGALCGINCVRYGGVSDCEVQNGTCAPVYDREMQANYTCIDRCRAAPVMNISLSSGPCLSDNMSWDVPGWVCDVAHEPRAAVDNQPENQCQSYLSGSAHHFVEVTPECEFIRSE